jgi:predicted NodU family carbamoyl transferase
MLKILGAGQTVHDTTWYDETMHYQAERYSRIKGNTRWSGIDVQAVFWKEHIRPKLDEYDVIAYSMPHRDHRWLDNPDIAFHHKEAISFKPKKLFDYIMRGDNGRNFFFSDHHQHHAIYAKLHSGFDECDTLALDGGAGHFTGIWVDKDDNIEDLTQDWNIGPLWALTTGPCDLRVAEGMAAAGKVMGLSAYGEVHLGMYHRLRTIAEDGTRSMKQATNEYNEERIRRYMERHKVRKKDLAASMQCLTNDMIHEMVVDRQTSKNICVSGGVAYNGYMNEILTEYYDNVFVPPAVHDGGISIGSYMHADYVLNNNIHVPPLYAGAQHPVNEEVFFGMKYKKMTMDEIYPYIAKEIAKGAIVGWFQGRSESGNRALGNRSILADPRNPHIKDIINHTVKLREDFRPFAPSVLIEDYQEYFDTNQPSPYMSRIMPVKEDKRSVIPGVTHVDGTARIQTVDKSFNEKYWNLINAFKQETGVPMLLNTSFNCQEPIVETPEDALKTFKRPEVKLNILVIEDYVVLK